MSIAQSNQTPEAPTQGTIAEGDLGDLMRGLGIAARAALRALTRAAAAQKNAALLAAAAAIRANETAILQANALDIAHGREKGLRDSLIDRLVLDADRLEGIAAGLEAIAALPDPVGTVIDTWTRPNGLEISRVRVPLGVIGIIYESRPNVTADAGGICLKSGNAVILRGGSESLHSSQAIVDCLHHGLKLAGLPEAAVQLVPTATAPPSAIFWPCRTTSTSSCHAAASR